MDSGPPADNVRSVERALAVLQAMNRQPVSSVADLHRATGLPKPTLVRLLRTMVSAGYLTNDARQGGYQLTSLVTSLSCGYHGDPLVVEAARLPAIALTRTLKWPVGIAVFDRDAVVVRFSTVPDSPMSPFHATINMRLSLFTRALGRAYLAFCPDDQIEAVTQSLVDSSHPENALARDRDRLWRMVHQVRSAGFALRDPSVEPRSSGTVAVPLSIEGQVIASIGITYFISAVRSESVIRGYADALMKVREQLAERVSQLRWPESP